MNIREILVRRSLRALIEALISQDQVRSFVLSQVEKALYKEAQETGMQWSLRQVQQDRLDCASALLHGLDRLMQRGFISKKCLRSVLEGFLGNVFLNEDSQKALNKLGFDPPSFITISPTGKCNLKCTGCYASDAALRGGQLSFEVFDRICREKRELFGSHFTVISGGEPFLWRDGEWDLLKLAARHPQDVFMVYTNGTLLDEKLVARIAETGNVSPCISVEGFEVETDGRRGHGVFQKILDAMANLRKYGVIFGISATATKNNWELITSEKFTDFYYFDQGALYCWIFQYMPIGRGQTFDLVVPPEARVEMLKRMWRLVRERQVFMVDFWNSGTASLGCIAAGRGTGYFYINWDGDIMPCVFAPYAAANINELYARGENLIAALNTPLFRRIREWQNDYGYEAPPHKTGNWLCPCAIRDHFDEFARAVRECGGRPINEEAQQAMADPTYYEKMVEYGKRMQELTAEMWREQYLEQEQDMPLAPSRERERVAAG